MLQNADSRAFETGEWGKILEIVTQMYFLCCHASNCVSPLAGVASARGIVGTGGL